MRLLGAFQKRFAADPCLVRDVQADERHRQPRTHHGLRCVGVGEKVELRDRRYVAYAVERTAHHNDVAYVAHRFRQALEGGGDIG